MKKLLKLALSLTLVLTLLTGCGSQNGDTQPEPTATPEVTEAPAAEPTEESAAADDKSVNIAVTSTLTSLNPLLIDATEIVKYALSLEFLPLVELNADLEFVPQLAESITTEDNLTFTIKLQDGAVWSDGTPVTAKDVEFTFLLITSPEAGMAVLNQYLIAGTDDNGMMPSGATEISGVQVVDEKTINVTTKWETALYTFENNFGRYLFTLPEHVLGEVPRDQLLAYAWFDKPDVISGPYFIQEADLNHYVHYVANENYFLGAPKIKYLNMNVVAPSQFLAGLQSGEIDLIQQTMGSIPLEDYDAIRALSGVEAVMGTPVTNESIFINVENVPDVRIRQALLYGIDRQMILDNLVNGNGEIVDAFLCSGSPFYSAELGVTAYDPQKAAALIAEAAADGASTTLDWYVNSSETAFVNAVQLIAATFEGLGLTITPHTVDLSTLMTVADDGTFDVMSVEYTYAPVDPYTDVAWLLSADGWTRYYNPDLDEPFQLTQSTTDLNASVEAYLTIDRAVVEDVPMISAYIISTMGAVSSRLHNAHPDVFGTFVNVHEWDVE